MPRDLKGLKVLVAGLGRSGLAAIELLVEKGAHPLGTDSQPVEQLSGAGSVFQKHGVRYVPYTKETFGAAELVVLSPGIAVDSAEVLAARNAGVPVIGEVELASWFLQGPVIGVTGSNGKTTSTALAGHLLKECGIACQVGGNIGVAPTAMVASSAVGQWNVLELSSFQLETIEEFRAEIATCINITPDHLDRHHTFEAYAAAKRRLFETQRSGDWAVLNADSAPVAEFAERIPAQVVWFSQEQQIDDGWCVDAEGVIRCNGHRVMAVREVPLRGRHNIENVMAAGACAHLAGAPLEGIRAGVMSFPGVEHRIEFVRERKGVAYYNDSKATNVDATLKAIDAFDGGLWIILGGKDKGSDYRPLRDPLEKKAKAALLIGAAAGKIGGELEGAVPLIECGTLECAVERASELAEAGDTVLLAPACASFDQFSGYEERGRMFKTFVGKLV